MSVADIAKVQHDSKRTQSILLISVKFFLEWSPDVGMVDTVAMSWESMHLCGWNDKRLGFGRALQIGFIHCQPATKFSLMYYNIYILISMILIITIFIITLFLIFIVMLLILILIVLIVY